jgi:hypothetical protein
MHWRNVAFQRSAELLGALHAPKTAFQKSPLKHPPQVIDSARPRIAFPSIQKYMIVEDFGQAT